MSSAIRLQDAYTEIVNRDGLQSDASQQQIVDALQALQDKLQHAPGLWERLQSRITAGQSQAPVTGLYLWGGVGRGKTFLMDLFYDTLQLSRKKRIHFHRLMRDVHERLRALGETDNPLEKVAAEIASEIDVLCFDEFFVSDIADAMILGGLLQALFANGVTLVTTSNLPPDRLYTGGLQRERFLPAIAAIEEHTNVMHLDSDTDYRLQTMQQAGTWLTPVDEDANARLLQIFTRIAPGEIIEGRVLDILGREIPTERCAKGVAWFDFWQICDGPRSQNDYIEIARWCQAVIVSGTPVLDGNLENQTRRFISMVDEFYDRRVKLIVSAAAPIDQLYIGSKLSFEYDRTQSRLTEMQSAKYLHEPHIA